MKKKLWHKRIPTIVAIILVFASIWVTSFLIQTGVIYVGQASPNKMPQNVKISNISDSSFTVSFTTSEESLSGLSVQEGLAPSFLVYDVRNTKSGSRDSFFSHYITVDNLKPNTTYNFSILSDGKTYLDNDNLYSITTAQSITEEYIEYSPITGRVILGNGVPADDTIVELSVNGAQRISTLTNADGEYTLTTTTIRTSSLESYFIFQINQEITINAFSGSTISSINARFSENNTIPTIALNQSYDFTTTDKTEGATLSAELTIPTPIIGAGEVRITTPRENQSFVDTQPSFRGTALPRERVKIVIDPNQEVQAEEVSDGNGVWIFRPEDSLTPGEHTITIESRDKFGILKSVSQTFSIFSSGTQVTDTATPSATPTTIPTSTPTPAVSPTISLTPTLTITPTASPTIALSPTIVPLNTIAPSPTQTTNITPPAPGNTTAIILTLGSVLLIVAGGALLFLL